MKQATVFPILLFCIAAFIACVKQAEAQGSVESDRAALVALYDATGGDNWNDNTNWKSDKPLDQWYGITTDNNGRVTRIDLSNNNLTGSIPSELDNFTNLLILYLDHNNLSGSIPPVICNLLPKMRKFNINENWELINDCFSIPDELLNNERRYFTSELSDNLIIGNKDVEFILLQENQYGVLWMSIDVFNHVYIPLKSIRELLNYVFTSVPIDPTKGVLEYNRNLLGTVLENPRTGERKSDILLSLFRRYQGLATNHRSYINLYTFNSQDPDFKIIGTSMLITHEYAHNIHRAYGGNISFFAEGLAEWTSRDLVFNERNKRGVFQPTYEYSNKSLFNPIPFSYHEARFFMAYLADRIGIENMKHLIQVCKPGGICDVDNPDNGDWYNNIEGMDYALSLINPDLTLEKIVIDFHTTNLVNDTSIVLNGIEYGYKPIRYRDDSFKITPDIIVDFRSNSFSQKEIELKPGGVDYIAYKNTSNLHFAIDTNNKQLTLLRLFKEKGDTKELVDIDRNVDEYMVSGGYDRVTLIAVHGNPKPDQPDITLNISATQNYGVATENEELPTAFSLEQNYPNPFNPSTSIGWSQPQAAQVSLSVYNMLGQKVATLVDDFRPAGIHEIRLDALNWTSGVYVYVLEAGAKTFTQRMVLLK